MIHWSAPPDVGWLGAAAGPWRWSWGSRSRACCRLAWSWAPASLSKSLQYVRLAWLSTESRGSRRVKPRSTWYFRWCSWPWLPKRLCDLVSAVTPSDSRRLLLCVRSHSGCNWRATPAAGAWARSPMTAPAARTARWPARIAQSPGCWPAQSRSWLLASRLACSLAPALALELWKLWHWLRVPELDQRLPLEVAARVWELSSMVEARSWHHGGHEGPSANWTFTTSRQFSFGSTCKEDKPGLLRGASPLPWSHSPSTRPPQWRAGAFESKSWPSGSYESVDGSFNPFWKVCPSSNRHTEALGSWTRGGLVR